MTKAACKWIRRGLFCSSESRSVFASVPNDVKSLKEIRERASAFIVKKEAGIVWR
jgi:hypothetical protein